MTLTEEQIRKDDERWNRLSVEVELKYSGREVGERVRTTVDELHYHAWLHRAALKRIQESKPEVRGKWIYDCYYEQEWYKCSNCGDNSPCSTGGWAVKTNYCPNCGAKMDEEESENV